MAKTIHVGDNDFQQEVLASDTPVLVDFWADWCGPCNRVAREVEALASEMTGRLKVVKVNTDLDPETATRYGVHFDLFVRSERSRLIGAHPPGIPGTSRQRRQVLQTRRTDALTDSIVSFKNNVHTISGFHCAPSRGPMASIRQGSAEPWRFPDPPLCTSLRGRTAHPGASSRGPGS